MCLSKAETEDEFYLFHVVKFKICVLKEVVNTDYLFVM